jgi:hypothetical protein
MGRNDYSQYGNKSLEEQIQIVIQEFWESPFGDEVTGNWTWARRNITNHPRTFAQWEEMTKVNPNFVLKLEWRPVEKNLKERIYEEYNVGFGSFESNNTEIPHQSQINSDTIIHSVNDAIERR